MIFDTLFGNRKEQLFLGATNPSGAVALNDTMFIVGDDEDNLLRIYDRTKPQQSQQTIALSSVFSGQIEDGDGMEIDLESAAAINNTVFWIGSHSTGKKGQLRPARHRLFAVNIIPGNNSSFTITAVGQIYTNLINDLANDARFNQYRFADAQNTQAKAIGGLSIEGLAASFDNGLLIGFRNPLSGGEIKKDRLKNGKAIIVNLINPFEVIHGLPAKFADPIELDLGGFGIREITRRKKNKYLIVAGPYHGNNADDGEKQEHGRLYEWSIKTGNVEQLDVDLEGYNIEAAVFYPDNDEHVQLLSDDGKLENAKGFRSVQISL